MRIIRFLSFFLSFFFSTLAQFLPAQTYRFQQQKPHGTEIESIAVSPDGKFVATGDQGGEVIIWTVPDGNIYRNFTRRQAPVHNLKFSQDGKYLVASGWEKQSYYGEVNIWNWKTGELIAEKKFDKGELLIMPPAGKTFYVVSVAEVDYTEAIMFTEMDYKATPLRSFTLPAEVDPFIESHLSPDGKRLGCISNAGGHYDVYSVELATGKHSGIVKVENHIHPYVSDEGKLFALSIESGALMASALNAGSEPGAPSPIHVPFPLLDELNDAFRLYEPRSKKVWNMSEEHYIGDLFMKEWAVSPTGEYFVTSHWWHPTWVPDGPDYEKYQAFLFWSIGKETMVRGMDCIISEVLSLEEYNGGKIVMGRHAPAEVWDPARFDGYASMPGGTEQLMEVFASPESWDIFYSQYHALNGAYCSAANPQEETIQPYRDGGRASVAKNFSLGAYLPTDYMQARDITFFDPVKLIGKGEYKAPQMAHRTATSPDGKKVAVLTDWNDLAHQVLIVDTYSKKSIASFDVVRGPLPLFTAPKAGMVFSDDGTLLVVAKDTVTYIFDTRLKAVMGEIICLARVDSYDPVAIHPLNTWVTIAGRDGKLYLVDGSTWELQGSLPGGDGNITCMAFSSDGNTFYAGYSDGTVRVWNMTDQTLSATFIGMGEGNFLAYTPDGYYMGAGRGLSLAGYYLGEEFISWQSMDVKYNRPDIVLERLHKSSGVMIKMIKLAWEKRMERSPVNEVNMNATSRPVASIVNKGELPYFVKESSLTFTVKATDPSGTLAELKVYHNGVPASKYPLTGPSAEKAVPLQLRPGLNKFEFVAINAKGVESSREYFEADWQTEGTTKGNLYVFCVGVSEFTDNSRNLDFAAADATEMAAVLKRSPAFASVNVKTLLNKDVTRENLMKEVKFLEQAKPNDAIVFFISTHGLLDDGMNYFLAMNDVDFSNPSGKGMPYYELENILNSLPCLNRVMFIDACHSGEVDPAEAELAEKSGGDAKVKAKSGSFSAQPKAGLANSFDYMNVLFTDMSKESGAHIIGAAAGYQVALESGAWKHGAFTFALSAGLSSKAADANGDKQVTVSELQQYLQETVRSLTNGQQTPALRNVNPDNNFRLW